MNENNNIPLHRTVHWRRLKELLETICNNEKIDLKNYNTNNIICYRTVGSELKGRNVTYCENLNASCWVRDNNYDVFEISNIKNNSPIKIIGEFLFLVHNTSYDYWILCKSKIKINEEKLQYNCFEEKVEFKPIGRYSYIGRMCYKERFARKNDIWRKLYQL